MATVFTIGYEGANVSDLTATLRKAGVRHLVDVRQLPQSRRPGFSKRVLSEALAEAGIGYEHVRQLGDPKPGRDAARRGDMDQFRAIFHAHLELPLTVAALDAVADAVEAAPTVLLCYERQPKDCHRSLVAARIAALRSVEIRHLGVGHHVESRDAERIGVEQHA